MRSGASLILQALAIAFMAGAIRWLFNAKAPLYPVARGNQNVYEIKWQWQAVGLGGGAFWILLSAWQWLERSTPPDGVLSAMTLAFVTAGLWMATGAVITSPTGITKKGLFRSRSLEWHDISEIRSHKKQGGAIELRAGPKKLIIDFRVIAFQHLLCEIEERTRLKASSVA